MSLLRFPGIRNWLLLVAAFALLIFGLVLQFLIFQSDVLDYQSYMDLEARAEYSLVEKSVQSILDSGKDPNSSDVRAMLDSVQACRFWWIPVKGSEIFFRGINKPRKEFPSWFKRIAPLSAPMESRMIYHDHQYLGRLDIRFSTRAWRNHLWDVFLRQIAIFISGMVFIFAVASWLIYRNLCSIKELKGIISGITKTDFGTHFQIPKGISNEIGDLVTAVRKQFSFDLERIINAVNGATDAISICNPDGKAIFLNRAFQDLFGYSISEVNEQGGTANALGSRVLIDQGTPIIKAGGAWNGEIEVRNKSGKVFPVFMRGNAIRDELGRIIGFIGVISDLSERKYAEQLVNRMGRILDSSLNEIYVFDADTLKFSQVSHGAQQNLGYSWEELKEMTPVDIKPLFDKASFNNMISPLRMGNLGQLRFETLHRRKDGTDYPVEVLLQFSNEEPAPIFFAVIRDISSQRGMEEALRKSEEKFRALVETTHDWFWEVDTEGVITYSSPRVKEILGYEPSEMIGHHPSHYMPGGEAERVSKIFAGFAKDRKPFALLENINVHKNGTMVVLESSGIPIFNELGTFIGYRGIDRDITERKLVEQEILKSREELRELSDYLQTVREEEKANIAREIHDELGGLLTAMKMDLFMMNKKFDDPNFLAKEKLESMLKLVDEAVQVTRRISTQLRPTVLDDLGLIAAIEWQVSEFQTRMGIQCQFIHPTHELDIDEKRSIALFRVLQESLTNVARHSEATQVNVILQSTNGNIFLAIEDNGLGFAEDDLKKPLSHGLRGIKERARQFGGEVDIHSERGMGSTVMVYFPDMNDLRTEVPA